MKNIVTHGMNFHNDDLFATAVVFLYLKKTSPKEKFKFSRVIGFNSKLWQEANIVYDIGGIYDEKKNRFDHHQEGGAGVRENGIPYASVGLVWKKFGKKIAGSQEIADYVDRKIVQPIDAEDNGVEIYNLKSDKLGPFTIQDLVYMRCEQAGKIYDTTKDAKEFDRAFKKLVPLAEEIILGLVEKGKYKVAAAKKAEAVMKKTKDKRIVILDKFIGFDFSAFPEPLVTVYPSMRLKGHWCAKTVKKSDRKDLFEARIYFPKEWRGKTGEELAKVTGIPEANFCHNSGFLIDAKSKEGVLKLVEKALNVI